MKILVPLVNGFEEIEAISAIDILRRADIEVVTAGLPGTMVTGDRGVKIIADKMLKDIDPEEFQALVLPGGRGSPSLTKSTKMMDIINDFHKKDKLIAAICYSPVLLARKGLLDGKRATVYPGNEKELPKPRGEKVVVDGNLITSQGPGTAIEFALKIVEVLAGKPKSDKLRKGIVA
jgi:4-methyl-5(b-hydroxyethyl)-thiazole monophosphate biosynthesis